MDSSDPSQVSRLLKQAREDRESAFAQLVPLVHEELRRVAGALMSRERHGHTLEPTCLVNEAYLRIENQKDLDWQDRAQFLGVAAHLMRQILVDHARRKLAEKRGGGRARVTLSEDMALDGDNQVEVLDLHEKLELFREQSERRARVVELRFFGGLTFEEAAHVLGVSPKTVEADWYLARAWLRRELSGGTP